ncbi:MAG: acyl-CoA synthetase, partial [Acidimicrobiales bacterium]|nr:acyl-CoA synthetase [Acidimicrobiales bacterium]
MARPFTFADTIEVVADTLPDHTALITENRRLTFRELDERATRLAHALAARGVGAGDHVGLYLHNGTEYVEGMLGCWKIRAVPINVNYRYVEDELVYLFDDADLVSVVHHREFAPVIAAVTHRVPGVTSFLSVEDGSDADVGGLDTAHHPVAEYEAALAEQSPERDFAERSGDDLYMLYTGGTTGMPKGVMWRQEDIFFAAMDGSAMGVAPRPDTPEDLAERVKQSGGTLTMATAAPLMHGAAQWATFICLHSGSAMVLPSTHRFDPAAIWRNVCDEKVMTMTVVGDAMARPLVEELVAHRDQYDLSNFFALGSGGAILSAGVKQQLLDVLPDLIINDSFGASETGAQGTAVGASDEGHPQFAVTPSTNVLDEHLDPIEPGSGQRGLLARTGHIPLGYYKAEAKTAETFKVDRHGVRWVIPGDWATVEEDGSITLFGRGSVSINSGGEKIFPEEVEAALKSHPEVFDAVVVGVPDERFGERVTAVVAP